MSTARRGKIARCPPHIREEVNRRLHAGESGTTILAWLNANEEVLRVLDQHFAEQPISPQNLSEWRQGGYQEWLDRHEQLDRTKELSDYAAQLATSHRDAAGGNAAIVGGQLLEIFESLDVQAQKELLKEKPGNYVFLIDALARLEKSQADRVKAEAGRDMVKIQQRRAEQAEEKLRLEREKHEVKTCELFLRFYDDRKAAEIVEGKANRQVKLEQLRLHIFGAPPDQS